MKVKWLGHSAFVITASDGTRILTDPYRAGSFDGAVGYGPIAEEVGVITVSHDHDDHNGVEGLPGHPEVIRSCGEHKSHGVHIQGFDCYHDESKGSERGGNIIFVMEMDGIRVGHLGDLGHALSADAIDGIGAVDILLIPVGGFFTIGAGQAAVISGALKAKVIIPMHFKTESLGFPVAPVDDFLKEMGSYERPETSEVEITRESLSQGRRVIVLEHAL